MNSNKRVLHYLKPYIGNIVISLLCSLIVVIVQLLIPIYSGKAIDAMVENISDYKVIINYALLIILIACISSLCQYISNRVNQKMTYNISSNLRNAAFNKIHKLSLSYLDSHLSGDILNRIIMDVDTFCDGLLQTFTQLFTGILSIVGTIIIMLRMNITVGLAVIIITPVSVFISKFIASRINSYFKDANSLRSKQTAYINELVDAQRIVKIFNYEDKNIKEFNKIDDDLNKATIKSVYFSSLINPSTRLINNIVYAFTGLISCLFALSGSITIGEISVFLNYASSYGKPFNEISSVIGELQNSLNCAAHIFELLDEQEEIEDKDIINFKAKGDVSFNNISFGYTKDRILFKNFSLDVRKGQHIAIVGPTGAGKTSLINLIMRFYDVNDGSITIDNKDIRDLNRYDLRNNCGMVLQETWLKSGTIKQNIAYGNVNASDEDIIEAAKKAHAHNFIMRLPNGYDTYINENGSLLSQGEKQLLCIARVMLNSPSILILDEATSSIDTRTEINIQKAFYKMMKGKTSFIVAHRLSTIRDADIILVMDNGDIKESGSHKDLLKKKGFYYNLYHSQFKNVD